MTGTIVSLLHQAYRLSAPLADGILAEEGLRFSSWLALMLIDEGAADTGGAVARLIGHDSGATARLLEQLEGRGLVVRRRSELDRRIVHLALTAEGAMAADRLAPRVSATCDDLFAGFAAEEVASLGALLQRLVGRLQAVAEERRAT